MSNFTHDLIINVLRPEKHLIIVTFSPREELDPKYSRVFTEVDRMNDSHRKEYSNYTEIVHNCEEIINENIDKYKIKVVSKEFITIYGGRAYGVETDVHYTLLSW